MYPIDKPPSLPQLDVRRPGRPRAHGSAYLLAAALAAVGIAGCAAPTRAVRTDGPPSPTTSAALRTRAADAEATAELAERARALAPEGPADLATCVAIALRNHPREGAAEAEVALAEATLQELQSGALPRFRVTRTPQVVDDQPEHPRSGDAIATEAAALERMVQAGLGTPNSPATETALADAHRRSRRQRQQVAAEDAHGIARDHDPWVTTMQIAYPLLGSGRAGADRRRARVALDFAESRAEATRRGTALRVISRYQTLVFSRQMLELGQSTQVRMRALVDLAAQLRAAGAEHVDDADLRRARLVSSTVDARVEALTGELSLARIQLASAMGLSTDTVIEPAETQLTLEHHEALEADLVAQAFARRPDWHQMELGLRAADGAVDEAQGRGSATLAAFGSLQRRENDYDQNLADSFDDALVIGIEFEVPLFSGFVTEVRVARARAQRRKVHELRRALMNRIRTQVGTERTRMHAARSEFTATEQALADACRNRETLLREYETGRAPTVDAVEAELLEAFCAAGRMRALLDYNVALARLRFSAGSGLPVTDEADAAR